MNDVLFDSQYLIDNAFPLIYTLVKRLPKRVLYMEKVK